MLCFIDTVCEIILIMHFTSDHAPPYKERFERNFFSRMQPKFLTHMLPVFCFPSLPQNPARMDLKSLQVKTFRRALLHEYPGIRINQVKWNPNDKSHQYYAIGYQAGFVRVRPFRLK